VTSSEDLGARQWRSATIAFIYTGINNKYLGTIFSMTPNLSLGYRSDPAQTDLDRDRNHPNDPNNLTVIHTIIPKYYSENNPP